MNSPQDEMARAIKILQEACKEAGIAFVPPAIASVGHGTVPIMLRKTASIGEEMVSRSYPLLLSHEFLSDLPGTRGHQEKLKWYLHSLSFRLANPVETGYLTALGIPVVIDIEWPVRRSPDGRDAYFVRVGVQVRPMADWEANLAVLISGTVTVMALPSLVPVFTESLIVNVARKAVDSGAIRFYESGMHPQELQRVQVMSSDYDHKKRGFLFLNAQDSQISDFIKRKVYWLGFREGRQKTEVWIADPYDAEYLSTTPTRMRQFAEILAAHDVVHLDSTRDFAYAQKALLEEALMFEEELRKRVPGASVSPKIRQMEGQPEGRGPSAFISYSSQDKEFAEKLATDLKNQELGVWFDKWEIKVGDSLIEKIGHAIRQKDYLIVILSPHSVASEWVKKELNEAMQREIAEKRVVVLPVLYWTCELPPFLRDKKYADFTKSYEQGFNELVEGIRR